jgi:coenzyme Q-binding protein COQ10
MPSFSDKRRVPFTADEMFRLVADVERYPEFLPMCESLRIETRRPTAEREELVATMGVGYKAIREHFTTRVELLPARSEIHVAYVDGPFRHLMNRWRFVAMPDGCIVDFHIDYEFKSPLLAILMGAVFDKAFHRFSEAFEERARKVYGPRGAVGT